jgi:hypothetical protein
MWGLVIAKGLVQAEVHCLEATAKIPLGNTPRVLTPSQVRTLKNH